MNFVIKRELLLDRVMEDIDSYTIEWSEFWSGIDSDGSETKVKVSLSVTAFDAVLIQRNKPAEGHERNLLRDFIASHNAVVHW